MQGLCTNACRFPAWSSAAVGSHTEAVRSLRPAAPAVHAQAPDAAQPRGQHLPRAGVRRGRHAQGPLPALPPGEGRRRGRPDHDRRLGGGVAGQPAGVRQPAALQGRDRAVAASADRRRPRGRRGGDVPGDPPRPAYQQLHRRLAAAGLPLARCASPPTAASPRSPSPGTSTGSSRTTPPPPSAAVAAGLDGIELQSYGHLFDAFHSPATNRRDDDLGGGLEARMAFPRRVVRAVRAAVGPDFVVGHADVDGRGQRRRARSRRGAAGARAVRRRRRRLPQRHQGHDRERRHPGPGDPLDGHAVGAVPRLRRRDPARGRASR